MIFSNFFDLFFLNFLIFQFFISIFFLFPKFSILIIFSLFFIFSNVPFCFCNFNCANFALIEILLQFSGARRKTRVCDLDSKDAFWMNHKGSPFPQVAEKIEEELEDYRSKEEDIKKMKSDMGLEGGNENDAALGLLSDNTQVKKLTKIIKNG